MATEYRINMKRYNGTDYDVMYPRTLIEQVTNGQRQIIVDTVSLGTSWTGTGPYTQVVTIDGVESDSKIDLQPDADVINKLMESGTTALYIVNDSGVATAVALGAAPTVALTIQCTITKTAAPPPPAPNFILNENSWKTIKWASENNVGQNYWSVGDTKKITMNGKVSDGLTLTNFETYVYILGFNHNEALEGSGIVFGGFKTAQTGGNDIALIDAGTGLSSTSGQWFNMNNSNTSAGGWQASPMRTVTMPLIKAAFPSDLQSVIKTSTIYTDNVGGGTGDVQSNVTATQDDVYLLSEYEVFGSRKYANTYEASKQQQYAYYAAGNSKIKLIHDETIHHMATVTYWWERSPASSFSSEIEGSGLWFCLVQNDIASLSSAYTKEAVAPAFRV